MLSESVVRIARNSVETLRRIIYRIFERIIRSIVDWNSNEAILKIWVPSEIAIEPLGKYTKIFEKNPSQKNFQEAFGCLNGDINICGIG